MAFESSLRLQKYPRFLFADVLEALGLMTIHNHQISEEQLMLSKPFHRVGLSRRWQVF